MDTALIDRLAALEHEQWSTWAAALLAGEPGLSPERAARWRSDLVPYAALPEARKELDRQWARRALAILKDTP